MTWMIVTLWGVLVVVFVGIVLDEWNKNVRGIARCEECYQRIWFWQPHLYSWPWEEFEKVHVKCWTAWCKRWKDAAKFDVDPPRVQFRELSDLGIDLDEWPDE